MEYIKFSKFILLKEQEEEENEKTFFFTHEGEEYSASEGSRLIFARMKHPDKDEKQGISEMSFSATNKKGVEKIFTIKDLNKIKIKPQ